MQNIYIAKQITCAKRELQMRKNFYPQLVIAGKKTADSAEMEIEIMAAIIETLKLVQYFDFLNEEHVKTRCQIWANTHPTNRKDEK